MCEHLQPLDSALKESGMVETFRGEPWTKKTREWVYYDCLLDTDSLRARFSLPEFVVVHQNNDNRSGLEQGFYCTLCHDGVMGTHPAVPSKHTFA